jgi:hypothetical protein
MAPWIIYNLCKSLEIFSLLPISTKLTGIIRFFYLDVTWDLLNFYITLVMMDSFE